jgi:hypothetical protein
MPKIKTINVKESTFNCFEKLQTQLAADEKHPLSQDEALTRLMFEYERKKEWSME